MPSEAITNLYGNKIRLRVCGVLNIDSKYLFVNHRSLNPDNIFWNFPGGGLEDKEDIISCLKREFMEETHISIEVHELLHINEHISGALHSVELYFRVSSHNPGARLGQDPELDILSDLKWLTKDDLFHLPKTHYPEFTLHLTSK